MKKLAVILLSLTYLLLSIGVMLNMHYCGGELESVSLSSEKATCCCMPMPEENGCCSSEQVLLKYNNDEQVVSNSIKLVELFKYIDTQILILNDLSSEVIKEEFLSPEDKSPPPKLAIWKTNCSILFYG